MRGNRRAGMVLAMACGMVGGVAWGQGATAPTDGTSTIAATTEAATRPAQTPVVSERSVVHNDVAYGGPDAKLDTLDIYSPADARRAPVLIFVHGGEWTRGDKANVSSKPKFFNENGVVFVSVNYRLSPADKHPAQVEDVATSIAWVKKHIEQFGGDPSRIVIMGHSAGCHLGMLTALEGTALAKAGLRPTDIKGVVAWSGGMYDLVDRAKGEGMYPPFIKATFGEDEKAQREASPLTYAKNAKGGPTFLVASTDDEKSKTSREASQKFYEALQQSGGQVKTTILAGKTHFTANHELGAEGDKTGPELLQFVREVTADKPK
jgi:arylformamidase